MRHAVASGRADGKPPPASTILSAEEMDDTSPRSRESHARLGNLGVAMDLPDEFFCPITREKMHDPVTHELGLGSNTI